MPRLRYDVSVSLDGFITGPNPRPEEPLGDGGERLHDWMAGFTDYRDDRRAGTDPDAADAADRAHAGIGALVMGRGMFDAGEGPWGDDPPFGMPVFVVTHRARETVAKQGGTTYSFVTDGPEAALEQARAAAGGKDVGVAGGADLARQYLRAGLLDELMIHIAPMLLGGGVPLFDEGPPIELEPIDVTSSPGAAHLRYRVRR